mgnify:CR=1 FL=1
MTERLILDCDPGHDDAMAIMLAAAHPGLELLAITTVAGNQTLAKVTRNALAVCTIAGIHDVPVAAGAEGPLTRRQVVAPDIHGDTGLDGPVLPDPTVELDPRNAVDLIVQTVMSEPTGTVTLVPVGPLTNIALALQAEPEIARRVKRVSLMGGAYTRGNSTPAAEFNIYADPEAAAQVFDAGWPITMVGLDLTHQALADEAVFERLQAVEGPLGEFVVAMLRFFQSTYATSQGFTYPPVHDPCAVAALLDGIVGTERARVDVETQGRFTSGMTVVDFEAFRTVQHEGTPMNCDVATTIDVRKFWDVMIDAVTTLGSRP